MNTDTKQKIIEELIARDGYRCMFADCQLPFEGKHSLTLDHIFPRTLAKKAGWLVEQINDTCNLQLLGKTCNSKKGHLTPNEDGTYPIKAGKVKPIRPDICQECVSGRLLLGDERCSKCNSGAQPSTAPRSQRKEVRDCTHAGAEYCWMCYVGHIPRKSALEILVTGDVIAGVDKRARCV